MKKILSVVLALTMLLSFASCFGSEKATEGESKKFTAEGMTITLTDSFKKTEQEGYTVCYSAKDVLVVALKEEFTLQEGFENLSIIEYADLVYANNASKNPSDITSEDGLTIMEYTFFNEEYDQTYEYLSVMYKSSDAFWLVQFSCVEDDYDDNRDSFIKWAKSVEFAD